MAAPIAGPLRRAAARRACTPALHVRRRRPAPAVFAVAGRAPSSPSPPTPSAAPTPSSPPARTLSPPPSPSAFDDVVLLQAFSWDSCASTDGRTSWYASLAASAADLASLGFTHAWLPPPSASVSPEGYLPGQLYDLNSAYGSAEELGACLQALKAAGVTPLADAVLNHRCADSQDAAGAWNVFTDKVAHPGARLDWGPAELATPPDGRPSSYGARGRPDSGDDFAAAPDLDHTSPVVREGLADWLTWLASSVGFGGWRLDYVRGYDAGAAAFYMAASLPQDAFCVGELWPDLAYGSDGTPARDQAAALSRMESWLAGAERRAALFDFPLKGVLNAVLQGAAGWDRLGGSSAPPGLAGVARRRAVGFLDNHDTGPPPHGLGHWPSSTDAGAIARGYAYLLTHPLIPCVWAPHLDGGGGGSVRGAVAALLAARKAARVNAASSLEVLAAFKDMYVARVGGALTVKLGPRFDMDGLLPSSEDGWALACSGDGWAVWVKEQ